ncbi:MAG: hypothetical protein A2219_00820 [Elusimicrobia bacterium RIFOXYA2_FULL_50_26]|nr:MAG: hypothetical protein A2219_00820 [Elusimicrobia bacterium RIFOXYA2_FULL_50_26]OGS23201.1 MAG: hypothetical protein A2314_06290 [Elusimicrobia bacterium RIFOXYB2_FULL_50_12]
MRFLIFVIALSLSSCTRPSYPREKLTQSVEGIVKKECKLESHAALVGKTFYLKVALPGLVSSEANIKKEVLEKLQKVHLAITRVSLSSDAKIEYLVTIVELPGWKTHFSIVQRLDDLKWYFYQKISRGDFEDRIIYDLGLKNTGEGETFRDIDLREFVARLIVSKFNWLTVSNPFVSAAIGARLEIDSLSGNKLVLKTDSETLSDMSMEFIRATIMEWSAKIAHKYRFFEFSEISIINNSGRQVISIPIAQPEKLK